MNNDSSLEEGIKQRNVPRGEEALMHPSAHEPHSSAGRGTGEKYPQSEDSNHTRTKRGINIFPKTQCHIYSTFCSLLNSLLQ